MAEFTISLVGARGALLVDGRQPELFGELVGCTIRHSVPLPRSMGLQAVRDLAPAPVVEATLRLPLGPADRFTLVRDTSITTLTGPTESGVVGTGPGAAALLDRWLAAHPDGPGGALIAQARELLTGSTGR